MLRSSPLLLSLNIHVEDLAEDDFKHSLNSSRTFHPFIQTSPVFCHVREKELMEGQMYKSFNKTEGGTSRDRKPNKKKKKISA